MARRRLIWQLYPSFVLVTLIALIAVAWYCSHSFRRFYLEQTRNELDRLLDVVSEQISPALRTAQPADLDKLCKKLGQAGDGRTRVTVILPSGRVLGDSDEDPAVMEDHSNRDEIIDALEDGFGWTVRRSPTLGIKMMYVAVPIKEQGEAVAVVRAAVPVTAIDHALNNIRVKIFWAGLVIAVCAAGLSFIISRQISKPIVIIKRMAQRFASGELDLRLPIPDSVELADLSRALNETARQLQERISTITNQRNELEAILSSMIEGVLAVDGEGHIVSINKAAAGLLSIDPTQVRGRTVEEVVRNVDIQQLVRDTIESGEPTEGQIFLLTNGGRFFRLHGAGLVGSHGEKSGAVIVLNDMTRVRRLENVRRDFVANVSHELKTPITSILGFVEALREGAIDEPERARRFLEIIANHADRLNAIVEDLLSLSRLEEESEKRKLSFEKANVKPVLAAAIELSKSRASDKRMAIELSCRDDVDARINPALLEQAVVNLIDNAIKYSEPGSKIQVSVRREDGKIGIAVRDEGCGIERKHIARIFERFYVVDKGRSRKLGGTGLGLAIVKHIAQVHGGSVTVQSTPGKGSTFTIHLPPD
jgi:two-component system phosphate regulon sensor histidine kinase PhoR